MSLKAEICLINFNLDSDCSIGLLWNNLCWVWSSGHSEGGSPNGDWREPTVEEWQKRPVWSEMVNHCHNDVFGGSLCDVEHAKKHGDLCFCRAKGDCNTSPTECDLMYVKDLEQTKTGRTRARYCRSFSLLIFHF